MVVGAQGAWGFKSVAASPLAEDGGGKGGPIMVGGVVGKSGWRGRGGDRTAMFCFTSPAMQID